MAINQTTIDYVEKVVENDTVLANPATTATPAWLNTGRIQIPLYATILLLAVIGNFLVILTLVQNRRMRTITNVFLLNLAVSDILLGVLCMPFTLIGTLLRNFVFGEFMCKIIPFLQGEFDFIFYYYCSSGRCIFQNRFSVNNLIACNYA